MFTMTDEERAAVERLCRDLGVKRLDLFGSATGDAFDPDRSDLDFLGIRSIIPRSAVRCLL